MTSPRDDALDWIDQELANLAQSGLLRELSTHVGAQQAHLEIDGRELVNFGSNDYLGLAADSRLAAAAIAAARREGTGAGSSPLVTGHAAAHQELETALAAFEGTERALVFASGYAANIGAISALAGSGDAVYSDQKNHASMIDGCRLSRADVHIYPHRDAGALAAQLTRSRTYRRRLIVTESVYSMDGDLAPLEDLADLAERFDCMLLVDEAHATGVFGRSGRGLAEHLGVEERIHIRIGTLSKALGAAGGFVCGSAQLVEWLINRARPYIFSTALPPATCSAAEAALRLVAEGGVDREKLLHRADTLRQRLRNQGWEVGNSASQIVPVFVGEAERATELSGQLRDAGLLVPAIRPPSVPPGEALLRISLTVGHAQESIDRLVTALGATKAAVASTSG